MFIVSHAHYSTTYVDMAPTNSFPTENKEPISVMGANPSPGRGLEMAAYVRMLIQR